MSKEKNEFHLPILEKGLLPKLGIDISAATISEINHWMNILAGRAQESNKLDKLIFMFAGWLAFLLIGRACLKNKFAGVIEGKVR